MLVMHEVLILVVMEDGLVHGMTEVIVTDDGGLNPCCNGRWSRTRFQLRIAYAAEKS